MTPEFLMTMTPTLAQAPATEPGAPVPTNTGGEATTSTTGGGENRPLSENPPPPGLGGMLWPLMLILVIFWVMLILPQRREKKKRSQMMSALKKGDKVQTVGGVLGTIVELKEHEVVLKVDESTNTKMRFTRGAIHSVLSDGKPSEA